MELKYKIILLYAKRSISYNKKIFKRGTEDMLTKSSLFFASLQFGISQLFPHWRQNVLNSLKDGSADFSEELCCGDVLELWLGEFGGGGLLLGNIALFGLCFLTMVGADCFFRRIVGTGGYSLVNSLCGLFCFLKFHTGRLESNLLISVFILIWMFSGFMWWQAVIFLAGFTSVIAKGDVT